MVVGYQKFSAYKRFDRFNLLWLCPKQQQIDNAARVTQRSFVFCIYESQFGNGMVRTAYGISKESSDTEAFRGGIFGILGQSIKY